MGGSQSVCECVWVALPQPSALCRNKHNKLIATNIKLQLPRLNHKIYVIIVHEMFAAIGQKSYVLIFAHYILMRNEQKKTQHQKKNTKVQKNCNWNVSVP